MGVILTIPSNKTITQIAQGIIPAHKRIQRIGGVCRAGIGHQKHPGTTDRERLQSQFYGCDGIAFCVLEIIAISDSAMEANYQRLIPLQLLPQHRRPLPIIGRAQIGCASSRTLHDVGHADAMLKYPVVGFCVKRLGKQSGSVDSSPEAVARRGEVVSDFDRVEAWVQAYEDDVEVRLQIVRQRFHETNRIYKMVRIVGR